MFYSMQLSHDLLVPPKYLGPKLRDTLKEMLYQQVESTCTGQHGFIIAVTKIVDVSEGVILPGRGHVLFVVKYKAIIFRPFIGEVLDAVVKNVTKNGFFAHVGPLQVFISKHWISEDYQFDGDSHPPKFQSREGTTNIMEDSSVRIKIINMRINATDIFATGSIADEYLGVIVTDAFE